MLTMLHIKNVVLIDQLSLEFHQGLSALTGETGAGKSILLDSLGLALGARADAGMVRKGTDQAVVTAEFELGDGHRVFQVMRDHAIECHAPLILRRIVSQDGRSRAFINDEPVSIGLLKEIGDCLVDIHGQFETYGLLNPATHRQLLDDFAGNHDMCADCGLCFHNLKQAEQNLSEAKDKASRALENEAYLRQCVEELEKLAPEAGEELALVDKKKQVQNRDTILESLSMAVEQLGGDQGADILIGQVARNLSRQADKIGEESVKNIIDSLDRAAIEIQEAYRQVETILRGFSDHDMSIEAIEDRLYALRAAARKHGCPVDDLARIREEMGEKLKLIDYQDHVIRDLEKAINEAQRKFTDIANQLHDSRLKAAAKIDKAVNAELKPLKLDKAVFVTAVDKVEQPSEWTSTGYDTIQFRVATNGGNDFGPLNKIASGGEMARFMLALKLVLAQASKVQGVYVFDEIDTGIGGATASAVGARLAKLAEHHQVMVVTHSPQVASRASHHWVVSKATGGTQIKKLDSQSREEEIARMLSGSEITAEARAAASKLLEAG
jgi:DNA repair protein RecN (Recombination protein N)